MRLVVGLGNPGPRYEKTWHNLGWMVVRELARRQGVELKVGRGAYLLAEAGGVAMMLPTTYMNLSGEPVARWLRYHKVEPSQALILLDDHDLPVGRLRIRESGSAGGHRGLESIIRCIGTDAVPRLRVGIRGDEPPAELANYVLDQIPKSKQGLVELIVERAADAVSACITSGVLTAMNEYNGLSIE